MTSAWYLFLRKQRTKGKWGSNYALNSNMVNTKFQHHTPFVLPTKVTLKLAELHCLLNFYQWKISLPLFPPLANDHITLRHKTQYLRNPYAKTSTHYLHSYSSRFSFPPSLSTPSSKTYLSWDSLDTTPLLLYLGAWTVKYSPQDPPPQKKVSLVWCQLCDILSSVHYCTEGDVQISN